MLASRLLIETRKASGRLLPWHQNAKWIFWTKLSIKDLKQKSEHHHRILNTWNSLCTKSQLKLRILSSTYSKKCSGSKFQLRQTTFSFWNQFPKNRYFRLKTKKNEHHHWIFNFRIIISTKFQLKLIILIFWIKIAPEKGISG